MNSSVGPFCPLTIGGGQLTHLDTQMELFIFLFTMKRTPSNLFLSSHLSEVEEGCPPASSCPCTCQGWRGRCPPASSCQGSASNRGATIFHPDRVSTVLSCSALRFLLLLILWARSLPCVHSYPCVLCVCVCVCFTPSTPRCPP